MESITGTNPTDIDHLWWQTGIIYQIYPRSFQDTNGDGIGDLKGVVQRLDYLQWLGIDCVWLSPIYPSPMADFGYDISDYQGIHPLFGTMEDFDELLEQVHSRGMKLILDLVPNHTSDQHPWFLESRSSRDNPKRDWYIWHDAGENGALPNNWLSVFGGHAWEWDETTQQYYYHAFLKQQPDLNWRNPEVQQAMMDVMHFWLKKGVDGFRVDVMWHMIKDARLRNNPVAANTPFVASDLIYEYHDPVYSTDQPEVHEIVRMMRQVTNEYDERVLIGEIYLPIHKLVTYYGADKSGAHLPFNFQLLTLPWDSQQIARAIDEYEGALPADGWPNWVLGNHDQPRVASRVGRSQARVAAMLLLTLRGTPTIYYGDEICMRDVPIPQDEVVDPQGLNMPDRNVSRDPSRTPMQWDPDTNAGFTDSKPWLRLPYSYQRQNVALQKEDPDSMLSFYRSLINLRKRQPAFQTGKFTPVYSDKQLIAFIRENDEDRFLVVLNLSHRPAYLRPKNETYKGEIIISTETERIGLRVDNNLLLSGDEGLIVRLER
ncbi:alpha-amylase family glycosyl hydrolase [Dyadobacter fermentans]|uniref:Alpha amylase catalytic region n=1 Tax=Dyadobacter fermentans (strain ATCC 700827 / DSM 18053 / CIP 107007 / KCTC 52180 / NS114) TaxID=471854 RepID=C6VVS2_DYAFD|nr:alpha-amylase family glycosyl hydrolase [Dyadobacter fermentans]ACT91378.1 alpha amylase catalytic region [Dyadobacter fermentans DSM 18053]